MYYFKCADAACTYQIYTHLHKDTHGTCAHSYTHLYPHSIKTYITPNAPMLPAHAKFWEPQVGGA